MYVEQKLSVFVSVPLFTAILPTRVCPNITWCSCTTLTLVVPHTSHALFHTGQLIHITNQEHIQIIIIPFLFTLQTL